MGPLFTTCASFDVCVPRVPQLPVPVLDQPFVVGPGFSPIPATLVAQILASKYIDLSNLMATNLVQVEVDPQLLLNGRVILISGTKRPQRQIEDIVSLEEAFTLFTMVLTSFFPQ